MEFKASFLGFSFTIKISLSELTEIVKRLIESISDLIEAK